MLQTDNDLRMGEHGRFIRFGGVAILVGFLIHTVANGVLKQFPPEDPFTGKSSRGVF